MCRFPVSAIQQSRLPTRIPGPHKGKYVLPCDVIIHANHNLKFIILENVRNLADKKENWEVVKSELKKEDFLITEEPIILSPHEFGIPQVRERVYILGIRKDIANPEKLPYPRIRLKDLHLEDYYKECKPNAALDILEPSEDVSDDYLVPNDIVEVLDAWEEFRIATNLKKIGAPVWMCAFGLGIDEDYIFYYRSGYWQMPPWKQRFYEKNRALYNANREFIDQWVEKYHMTDRNKIHQKFEWNLGKDDVTMKETIIQIRQSGIRCKRTNYYPALVAMVNTPIVWDEDKNAYRFTTPREAANMQSFHGRYRLIGDDKTVYRQLGNSVNVRVLKILGNLTSPPRVIGG